MTLFSPNQIKFDKDYLKELTSEANSGVFRQQCKYHIALHPAQLNDFGESIKDELSRKIARFDESFQGIMLGYENVTLQSELGVIGPDNCYIHMDVQAFFFIFRPEIGMVLKGKVTRTTKDHVGCLVYNTFNISIPKPEESEEEGGWLGKKVTVNSEVEFEIIYVDLHARLPHIRGKLRAILTEGVGTDDDDSPIQSQKKHKKKKGRMDVDDDSLSTLDINEERPGKAKNKKIRFPDDDEPSSENLQEDIVQETPHRKKSKKKNKEKHRSAEPTEIVEMTKSKKKSKKDKTKQDKSEDMDVSLESLDIKSLFSDETMDFNGQPPENQTRADNSERKTKRKRSRSISQDPYLDQIKLEEDSDLERILSGK